MSHLDEDEDDVQGGALTLVAGVILFGYAVFVAGLAYVGSL
jgi:hypothetical protein